MKLHNCKYVLATGTTGRYAGCDLLAHPEVNELYCLWNCGFYSCESQVFSSLLTLMKHGIIPERIDYSLGFRHYKKNCLEKDIYPDFHQIDESQNIDLYLHDVPLPEANVASSYSIECDSYNQIINRFFNPSESVSTKKETLEKKYNIDYSKTIAVLYRGTDKHTEVTLAGAEEYLEVTKNILKDNPDFKVLIQTDQTQVAEYFSEQLGDKIIFFEELPLTKSSEALIYILERMGADSITWSQWVDAAFRCVSQCKYVVNHTGNGGLFVRLYRGNNKGIYQFDENGRLI